jgi:hypothetical protein
MALSQIFSFWRLPGENASGLKLLAFWKAILVFAHISEVQGVKTILLRIAHIQQKTASSQRIEFPDESSTVLRKLLAARVLSLAVKARTAVACLFFPSFRDLMQALHFEDKAMDFLPVASTFLTPG